MVFTSSPNWLGQKISTELRSATPFGVCGTEREGAAINMQTTDPKPGGKPAAQDQRGPAATSFGTRIRSARQTAGLSLRALAAQVDVAHGHLSNIERDQARPSWRLAGRIDAVVGLNGELLRAYPELLREAEQQKQARPKRRRRGTDAQGDQTPAPGNGTNGQKPRYSEATVGSELSRSRSPDGEAADGKEADTNRREAMKALGAVMATASVRARSFLRYAESSNVGPLTLDEYDDDVQWLTEHATRAPATRLFMVAEGKFTEVADLLQDGHHSGKQRTHLELLTGQFAYFQSRAAFALGHSGAVRSHMRIARHYAELLDHHLLRASVALHASGVAFYERRWTTSLRIAQEAQQWATPHTAARLAAEEARAYGSMGPTFRRQMAEALVRAERALPDVPVFEPGAESPFGPEMFAFRATTATVRCGDERAEEFARQAIAEFEALESRSDPRSSFEDLSLARLDLAIRLAQRKRPDPREAARLGAQVLTAPPELRTDPVKRRATELLVVLTSVPTWRTLPELKELGELVRTYRPLALPRPTQRRALGSQR
jgi:transcriptional regulator with XRE-family HTH domain